MPPFLSAILTILYVTLFVVTLLVIVSDEKGASAKIAWIIVISLLPAFGMISYYLLGMNFHRGIASQRNHKKFLEHFAADHAEELKELWDYCDNELPREYADLARLFGKGGACKPLSADEVTIYTEGQDKLEALLEDIKNAKKYIHMEYFYFRKGEMGNRFREALMQKAREGVKVRFIRENIANFDIPAHYYNVMRKAGVEVVRFTPVFSSLIMLPFRLNYRDHRKIAIIDGEVAYSGGMNISDDYYIRWRDTHYKVKGKLVSALQAAFLDAYITSGGKVDDTPFEELFPYLNRKEEGPVLAQAVPGDPDSRWPIISHGTEWELHNVHKYIWLQTPYFLPPESLLHAIKTAALKGTEVILMLPRKTDILLTTMANRAYYKECLEAGVRIFIKDGRFIHSKTLVADDNIALIGSANLDARSLELSYEMNTYFYDENIAAQCKAVFEKDMEECRELTLEEWKKTSEFKKLLWNIGRLLSPIL